MPRRSAGPHRLRCVTSFGRTSLADLLRGRERIEAELQQLIDERSMPWGITVQSVEMRDVIIPTSLQDAMSREAQAAREKSARIILGQAEVEIAQLFGQALLVYQANPTALHLRAMNILYEGLKEKGALDGGPQYGGRDDGTGRVARRGCHGPGSVVRIRARHTPRRGYRRSERTAADAGVAAQAVGASLIAAEQARERSSAAASRQLGRGDRGRSARLRNDRVEADAPGPTRKT